MSAFVGLTKEKKPVSSTLPAKTPNLEHYIAFSPMIWHHNLVVGTGSVL
jgi:hypothetical protein